MKMGERQRRPDNERQRNKVVIGIYLAGAAMVTASVVIEACS